MAELATNYLGLRLKHPICSSAGPLCWTIADCMNVHWRSQHGERRVRWPRWRIKEMLASREDGIWMFDSAPRFRKRRPARMLAPLLRQASWRIIVSMAYFIPVGPVMRELLASGPKIRHDPDRLATVLLELAAAGPARPGPSCAAS